MSIYTDEGYRDRRHYVLSMAEEYGVPAHIAIQLANLLGKDEDFDGLVTALQDYADSGGGNIEEF